jgi:hypothetical protein
MSKLSVIAPKNGKTEKIGEIDGDDVEPLGLTAHLGERAHHQLAELLGNGYGAKSFHLIVGEDMMVNCRVVERSHGCTIECIEVKPAPIVD